MNLPFNLKLPFNKKIEREYFLALILRDEKVSAVVFEEVHGKIKVVGEHEEDFATTLEETSYDTLLEIIDKTVSIAEENLPKGVETQKTIFGVKANWVVESQIKREHLVILKKLCDTLGLSPIGFLVVPEAVAHLLGKEEGAPISGLLTEIGNKNITVSVVRAGRVLETRKAKIEDSIPKTVDRILHHFTNHEILPSRIILYSGKLDDKLQQHFITHSWSKSLPFLHVPQITMLSKRFDAKAILFGAATQMGFDVLGEIDLPERKRTERVPHTIEKSEEPIKDELYESPDIVAEDTIEKSENINDFGFIVNGDIEKVEDTSGLPIKKAVSIKKEEIEEIPTKERSHDSSTEMEPTHAFEKAENFTIPSDTSFYPEEKSRSPRTAQLQALLAPLRIEKIQYFLNNGFKNIKSPISLSGIVTKGGKKPLVIIVGAGILLFALFMLYINMVSATVTIFVTPQSMEEKKTIIFSPTDSSNYTNNIISVEEITVSQDGSLSTPATGTKNVGEKAKGTITILSSLTREQTVPSGTSVTSSNGLLFTLDNAVKIASSSGLSDIKSITASVTAKDIGKEHNLPTGTKFSVGNFDRSSVEAKNDSAFSGGSKKEVTVVSKKDQDKLTAELPKKLEQEAKAQIGGQVSDTRELVPNYFNLALTQKQFDKKIEEEAKAVSLTATVEYQGFTYDKNDLQEFFKSIFEKDASLTLSQNSITYDIQNIKKGKNDDIQVDMIMKAALVPKLNLKDLPNELAGVSFANAEEKLQSINQVADIEIQLSPNLPFLPQFLPRMAKNIQVTIKTNE